MTPRYLAHRGSVVATGFVLDTSLIGLAEARRRVLGLWRPGATVREHCELLVISGLRAERVRVSGAPGAPLVEDRGVLATFPVEEDVEAPGRVLVARAGIVESIAMRDLREVDLASWLDLGDLALVRAEPLAPPPVRVVIPEPVTVDMRALTGVGSSDAGAAKLLEALRAARDGKRIEGGAAGGSMEPGALQRLVRWFGDRFKRPAATGTTTSRSTRGAGAQSTAIVQVKPSWIDRLRNQIATTLWTSRLGAAIGRRHAEYLKKMLDMFDNGDLDEALRHAVPLGGDGLPGGERVTVGLPQRRDDLDLSFSPRAGGGVIPAHESALQRMRERYRAAADRLEQAGRIDEAAFVYAELLGEVASAIALLERHKRFSVAARLAEGRGQPPAMVVRLWFIAGDRQRAIDLARRHDAWADAIAMLERRNDGAAPVLRMLWADHLADTGDFVKAVEVAWPLEPSRALIEAWIDRGIEGGGTAAARLMIKKLVVAPHAFATVGPKILDVLDARDRSGRRSAEETRRRIALIKELLAAPSCPELRTIARPALRSYVRDVGAGAMGATPDLVDGLLRYADDAALRADRPRLEPAPRGDVLLSRPQPISIRWSASDAGGLHVHDAATLPGDRTLVALGELGVRILGKTGKTIAHLEQPAMRLVVADSGTRAIAIAPRGQVSRLARIDLIERRGEHWCDTEIDSASTTFSGDVWLVTRKQQVFAADATANRWRALWGVDMPVTFIHPVVRRDGKYFCIEDAVSGEMWFYEGFTLRQRDVKVDVEYARISGACASQTWIAATDTHVRGPDWTVMLPFAGAPDALAANGSYVAVTQQGPDGAVVSIVHRGATRIIARLYLDGASDVRTRLAEDTLTLADNRGRVATLDLETGALFRDMRIVP